MPRMKRAARYVACREQSMNESELKKSQREKMAENARSAGAHPAGTGIGTAGGAVAGAAIGAVAGPVGAFVGAAIGAIAGGNTGLNAAGLVEEEHTQGFQKKTAARDGKEGTKDSEFDLPESSSPDIRDDRNLGGFSSAGQRQRDERKDGTV